MKIQPVIETINGTYFDFTDPHKHDYPIEEIAHALSNLCRFTGHITSFYSVAQHSILVSRLLPDHLRLAGLLHDAAEAYLGDVSSPLKALIPAYKILEHEVEWAIDSKYGTRLDPRDKGLIKLADTRLLVTERRDLLPASDHRAWDIFSHIEPLVNTITPMPPHKARAVFLKEYNKCVKAR